MGKSRFPYYLSIAANLVIAVFLWFLIHNEAGILRWVHGLNQFWFLFGAIIIIVLVAVVTELSTLYKQPKAVQALPQESGKSKVPNADSKAAS